MSSSTEVKNTVHSKLTGTDIDSSFEKCKLDDSVEWPDYESYYGSHEAQVVDSHVVVHYEYTLEGSVHLIFTKTEVVDDKVVDTTSRSYDVRSSDDTVWVDGANRHLGNTESRRMHPQDFALSMYMKDPVNDCLLARLKRVTGKECR